MRRLRQLHPRPLRTRVQHRTKNHSGRNGLALLAPAHELQALRIGRREPYLFERSGDASPVFGALVNSVQAVSAITFAEATMSSIATYSSG